MVKVINAKIQFRDSFKFVGKFYVNFVQYPFRQDVAS